MMDSATDVSPHASPDLNIMERLEMYSLENPSRTEYQVTTELEAQEILTAMAASLTMIASDMAKGADRNVMQDFAASYRLAVVRKDALQLFRDIAGVDDLVIFGLKLTVPVIVLN